MKTIKLSYRTWPASVVEAGLGISSGLIRVWKSKGLLHLPDDADPVPRGHHSLYSACSVAAVRALVDAGAGYDEVRHLGGHATATVQLHVLTEGEVEILDGIDFPHAGLAVLKDGFLNLAHYAKKQYFAFRTDPLALGSPNALQDFNEPASFFRWMNTGVHEFERPPGSDRNNFNRWTGRDYTPDELAAENARLEAEFERQEAEGGPKWRVLEYPDPKPLPPCETAHIIDAKLVATRLVTALGRPPLVVHVGEKPDPLSSGQRLPASLFVEKYAPELEAMIAEGRSL